MKKRYVTCNAYALGVLLVALCLAVAFTYKRASELDAKFVGMQSAQRALEGRQELLMSSEGVLASNQINTLMNFALYGDMHAINYLSAYYHKMNGSDIDAYIWGDGSPASFK